MYDVKDRIKGCFYAAGMGDAMGAPSEAMSKQEILEAYLNTVYLGYNSYGVGAAARSYFPDCRAVRMTSKFMGTTFSP